MLYYMYIYIYKHDDCRTHKPTQASSSSYVVNRVEAPSKTRNDDKQHNTTQHNTTQHNTTQHNTTQHNTTQHNTTHPSILWTDTGDTHTLYCHPSCLDEYAHTPSSVVVMRPTDAAPTPPSLDLDLDCVA